MDEPVAKAKKTSRWLWHGLWPKRHKGSDAAVVPRRGSLATACIRIAFAIGALVLMAMAAFGLLLARLSQGPIALDSLAPRVIAALQERFGDAYRFDLRQASLARDGNGFSLALQGMSVSDSSGRSVIATPMAQLSVDPLALALGQLVPRHLEIRDADLSLSILVDGKIAISAGVPGQPAIAIADAIPALTGPDGQSSRLDTLTDPAGPAEQPPAASVPGDAFDRASAALLALIEAATRPDSPLGALDQLGISHARLTVEDAFAHHTAIFEGVDVAVDRGDGSTRITLAVDGPNGRWSAKMRATGAQSGTRSLSVDISDLSFDDIALLAGWRAPGFVLDTPVSAHFEVAFGKNDRLEQGGGRIALGAGLFRQQDKDSEPVLIDEITGKFALEPASRGLRVDDLQFLGGASHFDFDGTIAAPDVARPGWAFNFAARSGSQFGPERPGEQPIVFDRIELVGSLLPDVQRLIINKFAMIGPDVETDFSLEQQYGTKPSLSLAGNARNTSLSHAVRLWPRNIAASARAWLLQHVLAGRLDRATIALDFDAETLDLLNAGRQPPDGALIIDMSLSGAAFNILPGLPPLAGLSASASVSGHKVSASVRQAFMDAGAGHRLEISDGSFNIADSGLKPAPAAISARLTGSVDTVTSLLSVESLKPFANLPLDPNAVKGQIDGKLFMDIKLGKPSSPESTQVRVAATLTNFVAEKLIGKERFDAGTLALTVDRTGVKASGQGKMFGQPASLDIKKSGNEAGVATINVTLDDSARTKLGLGNSGLSGPVNAKIVSALGLVNEVKAQVEVDFGKAAMDGLFPGFVKAAGKPAKASFQVTGDSNGTSLGALSFEGGGASLRGTVDLGADGAFKSGKFTQVRLSPGDDLRADVSRAADGLKLVVRGNVLDARPFQAQLFNPALESAKDKPAPDIDLDLKVGQVTGQNKQVLSGADIRMNRKGGQLRQLQFGGKFGSAALAGSLTAPGQLNLKSDNAGAFLAFADVYRRMEGGDLTLSLNLGNGRSDGSVLIHDFLLRDEPALRRLVTEGASVRSDNGRVQDTKFDPNLVEFQKLQVYFIKAGGRLDLRDGIMYGPQIGTSLEGIVDFAKNFVDVKGTFVPAYALNNFFARIPVIGLLLGGGSHEGLFAVNFRISGPASGPTLNINPLSAIAPGFLRKIFGSGEIPAGFQTKTGP